MLDVPHIPAEIAVWNLGPGESAVLALAYAQAGSIAVIDDRAARRCATTLGIPLIGTVGVVIKARRPGQIDAARREIERLRTAGLYRSNHAMNQALALVGE